MSAGGCILGHVDSPRPIKVPLGENWKGKLYKARGGTNRTRLNTVVVVDVA